MGVRNFVSFVGRHNVALSDRFAVLPALSIVDTSTVPVCEAKLVTGEQHRLVITERHANPARRSLLDQSPNQFEYALIVRPTIDEISVEHEHVVVVSPMEQPLVVAVDNRVGFRVVRKCHQRAASLVQIAMDIANTDNCRRRISISRERRDAVSERRL